MAPSKRALAKKANAAAGGQPASSGPTKAKFTKADWSETTKKKTAGVTDMTLLSTISNESVNENLKLRFKNAEIYTYIGHVLISVNPFRLLPIYDDATLKSYRGKNRLEVPPHVYSIAETMCYHMTSYQENQCVIISGESGAGKTEAAKRIMQYIAAVSGDEESGIQNIKEMVLATNPLLESFGCAKTLRNNNSSRHGKYLELEFDSKGAPVGAMITNYLLEKGRVVGQIQNERNFHIFYQLTKGASPEQREALGIQDPSSYTYTSQAKCLEVPGIDDVADYSETIRAMETIGISHDEQMSIFRQIASILWLGNVSFAADQDGNAYISDESVPNFVGYLMEVDAHIVSKALTSRTIETARGGRRGSVYDVPLNPAQAKSTRDALAKAIYNNLFEWIVQRVNISMKSKAGAAQSVIGILDIYGFEIFDNNSFEQLCINYVNEKLQQIFIELTLKREQEEYDREQIKWTPIEFFNNKVVCDLIEEKRPPGVFAALNDACATAHADPGAADSSFVQRMGQLSSNKHFEQRSGKFVIKHYAGDVTYDIPGMTDKNKDQLSRDLLDLIFSSGNQFLQGLFPDRPDPNSKKRPPTAGDRIKSSANLLVEKLMRSEPSYIRTIKPNSNKSPTEYDDKAILHQIQYLGLRENIRVRRAGFAYRNTFEKMVERFYLLSPKTSYAGDYIWEGDARSGCEQILRDTGISKDEWQMGITKAFIKNPETLFALEHMRDRYWHNMATRIQRAWRNYLRYKQECARRVQRFWKNKKEGIQYVEMRDYGHQLLAGRKERRRLSLLSMRQFRGDYLGVQKKDPQGDLLRGVTGITPTEPVPFSANAKILVSKLGRSSKPSPRFVIVTRNALYLLNTEQVQGRAQTTLERKIPLTAIRSIAMSGLRDDWMVINATTGEEGDVLLWCIFKTELAAVLLQQTGGSIQLNISNTLEYAKKKDKKTKVTFVKDENVRRDDVYKSQKVSVPSGQPPASLSDPPVPRKAGVVRPITGGKLLKPSGGSGATTTRRAAPARANNISSSKPAAASVVPAAQPRTTTTAAPSSTAKPGSRPVPPPPPPPPAASSGPDQYKALYDFPGTQPGEMGLVANEIVAVNQKEDSGWWLVEKNGQEGWSPANYLELVPRGTANGRPVPKPKPKPKPRP